MTRQYVFISYSRQDRAFVERLASGLRDAGVHTWTDLENIAAGQDWAQTIDRGLMQASALVYVVSKHSSQSRWMDEELTAFLEKQGRVIPIVIDDEGASHLPLPLRRIQWADFRGPFELALRSLLGGIRGLQGVSPVATPKAIDYGVKRLSFASDGQALSVEGADNVTEIQAGWQIRERCRRLSARKMPWWRRRTFRGHSELIAGLCDRLDAKAASAC